MAHDITQDNIRELLESFSRNIYRSRDAEPATLSHDVMEKCLYLFKLDYNTVEISNHGGELSAHYPHIIVIPENEKQKIDSFTPPPTIGTPATNNTSTQPRTQQQTIYENSFDAVKLRELINKSRFARSRTRFPVPVILYKNKYVCRSSTLSCGPEMYTRSGINYFFNGSPAAPPSPADDVNTDDPDVVEINESFRDDQENNPKSNSDWPLFDQTRSQDIKLLRAFNVGTIIDFMVEKKKVKFGLKVTSSEKVDKEKRYQEFTICSLPYPGCEFFRQFRDNDYTHENLVFDWSQTHVNADIGIPMDTITLQLQHIGWDQYKAWDLATITQNYMKLLLKYLQDNSSGLLIHCISGWDRTPLFVSLLRLTLWADGMIHQSLNAEQILYLTIAYDWYLFGHDLPDRLSKGEEIFVFCFYALKHLLGDEFSVIHRDRYRSKHNSSGGSSYIAIPQDHDSSGDAVDAEYHGSSVSLSSADGHDYQKIHQNDAHEFTNGNFAALNMNQDSNSSIELLPDPAPPINSSPVTKRKTSPVSVPLSSISRQRNESTSSVGSWQMVNQSGSLRSTDSGNLLHRFNSNVEMNGTSTSVDEEFYGRNQKAALARRRERLNSIRGLFYNCYCRAVGFKYKNHTELSFAAMWNSLVEVVGLPRMQ